MFVLLLLSDKEGKRGAEMSHRSSSKCNKLNDLVSGSSHPYCRRLLPQVFLQMKAEQCGKKVK